MNSMVISLEVKDEGSAVVKEFSDKTVSKVKQMSDKSIGHVQRLALAFSSKLGGAARTLEKSWNISVNPAPAISAIQTVETQARKMQQTLSAKPTVSINDQATPVLKKIQGEMAKIKSKTVYIKVVHTGTGSTERPLTDKISEIIGMYSRIPSHMAFSAEFSDKTVSKVKQMSDKSIGHVQRLALAFSSKLGGAARTLEKSWNISVNPAPAISAIQTVETQARKMQQTLSDKTVSKVKQMSDKSIGHVQRLALAFSSKLGGAARTLEKSWNISVNPAPAISAIQTVETQARKMQQTLSAKPTVSINDQATPVLKKIQGEMAKIKSKTVYIKVVHTGTGSTERPLTDKISEIIGMYSRIPSHMAFSADFSSYTSGLVSLTQQIHSLRYNAQAFSWGPWKDVGNRAYQMSELLTGVFQRAVNMQGVPVGAVGGREVSIGEINITVPDSAAPQTPEDWRLIVREYIIPEIERIG